MTSGWIQSRSNTDLGGPTADSRSILIQPEMDSARTEGVSKMDIRLVLNGARNDLRGTQDVCKIDHTGSMESGCVHWGIDN